jgi:hypothetical protein
MRRSSLTVIAAQRLPNYPLVAKDQLAATTFQFLAVQSRTRDSALDYRDHIPARLPFGRHRIWTTQTEVYFLDSSFFTTTPGQRGLPTAA